MGRDGANDTVAKALYNAGTGGVAKQKFLFGTLAQLAAMGDENGELDVHARTEVMQVARELHEHLRPAGRVIHPPEYPMPHTGRLGELADRLATLCGYRHTIKPGRQKGAFWSIWWIDHAFAQWLSGLRRHAAMNWQDAGANELEELRAFLEPVAAPAPDDERPLLARQAVARVRPFARALLEQDDDAHLDSTRLAYMLKNRMTLLYGWRPHFSLEDETRAEAEELLIDVWMAATRMQRALLLHPLLYAEMAVSDLEAALTKAKSARSQIRKACGVAQRGPKLDRDKWSRNCRAMYLDECRRRDNYWELVFGKHSEDNGRTAVSDVKDALSTYDSEKRGGDYFMFFGRDDGEELLSLSPLDMVRKL